MNERIWIRGGDMDALAEAFAERFGASTLLGAEAVVVPSPAIGRWLEQKLAMRYGIAVGFDAVLPGTQLWRLVRALNPATPKRTPFDAAPLALAIDEWLVDAALPFPKPVDALSRFVLAERIARVLDRYLMYRADWLLRVEQQRPTDPMEAWQAELWRWLRHRHPQPHRAGQWHELRHAFAHRVTARGWPATLHLFGFSQLPPDTLAPLLEFGHAGRCLLYQWTPSLGYYADEPVRRELRRSARAGDELPAVAHPLLSAWLGPARDFDHALFAADLAWRDEVETPSPPRGTSLLGRLQCGLDALDAEAPLVPADDSLRVEACPSIEREVERAFDAIQDALRADPDLRLDQIAIVASDPMRYAAAVAAVAASAEPPLALSGTALRIADHGSIEAWLLSWLDLPESRLPLGFLEQALALPALARRFEVEPDRARLAVAELAAAGARFGIDARHRGEWTAADPAQSMQAALSAWLLAWSLGSRAAQAVADAASPVAPSLSREIGACAALVGVLDAQREAMRTARSASAWAAWFSEAMDDLFDARSDADLRVLSQWRDWVGQLAALEEDAGRQTPLAYPVWRHLLRAGITRRGETPPSLVGGIAFGGMVALRGLPFRVVAALGLDEGAFPRIDRPASFDLTRTRPRRGDRDLGDDDRLLFLQLLLNTRDRFFCSYQSEDARGETMAASSVLRELVDFCAQRDASIERRAARFAVIDPQPGHARAWRHALRVGVESPWLPASRAVIDNLDALIRFHADPLGQRLADFGASSYLGSTLESEESYAADSRLQRSVARRLWLCRQRGESLAAAQSRLLAAGQWPRFGSAALATLAESIDQLNLRWRAEADRCGPAHWQSFSIPGLSLGGRVQLFGRDGLVSAQPIRPYADQFMRQWIRWLVLCSATSDAQQHWFWLLDHKIDHGKFRRPEQPAELLHDLIEAALEPAAPVVSPGLAFEAAKQWQAHGRIDEFALRQRWQGTRNQIGERQFSANRLLERGGGPFFDESFLRRVQQAWLPLVTHWVTPESRGAS